MTETAQQIVMDLVKAELSQFRPAQIEKVLQLLEEGNTVPFIARYRKEATGSLDEVEIREIEERHQYATNLHKRKEEVIRGYRTRRKDATRRGSLPPLQTKTPHESRNRPRKRLGSVCRVADERADERILISRGEGQGIPE